MGWEDVVEICLENRKGTAHQDEPALVAWLTARLSAAVFFTELRLDVFFRARSYIILGR